MIVPMILYTIMHFLLTNTCLLPHLTDQFVSKKYVKSILPILLNFFVEVCHIRTYWMKYVRFSSCLLPVPRRYHLGASSSPALNKLLILFTLYIKYHHVFYACIFAEKLLGCFGRKSCVDSKKGDASC